MKFSQNITNIGQGARICGGEERVRRGATLIKYRIIISLLDTEVRVGQPVYSKATTATFWLPARRKARRPSMRSSAESFW